MLTHWDTVTSPILQMREINISDVVMTHLGHNTTGTWIYIAWIQCPSSFIQKVVDICFMPGFMLAAKKKTTANKTWSGNRRENLTCENAILSFRNFDRRIYKFKEGDQFNLYHWFLSIESPFQNPLSSKGWAWVGLKKQGLTPSCSLFFVVRILSLACRWQPSHQGVLSLPLLI